MERRGIRHHGRPASGALGIRKWGARRRPAYTTGNRCTAAAYGCENPANRTREPHERWLPAEAAEIDLSAIAKGYGVDHVAAGLFSLGREDFLVEIGGEIRAAGERPGGGPWRVAIEKPIDEQRAIHSIIALHDQAMATSGDYRIFYHEDGRRISHTIDPRTGRPVEHGPASATAIATNATVADAWATTLMAMGEEGLRLAEYEGIAAMVLFRGAEGSVSVQKNRLFPEAVETSNAQPQSEAP